MGLIRLIVQRELSRRKLRNPRYSSASFARDLGLSTALLSMILSGQRTISKKTARIVLDRFELESSEVIMIRQMIDGEPLHDEKTRQHSEFKTLEADVFSAIADWQHFAILSLMKVRNFESSYEWIAQRLGLSVMEARESTARLIRLGLLKVNSEGRFVRTHQHLSSTCDIPSAALRRHHRQKLEKSIEVLETIPVEYREINSFSFAMNQKNLPKAKIFIRDFTEKMLTLLETKTSDEVYNLNVQLYPVTKINYNQETRRAK